jgi:hypothetical protein
MENLVEVVEAVALKAVKGAVVLLIRERTVEMVVEVEEVPVKKVRMVLRHITTLQMERHLVETEKNRLLLVS